MRGVADDLDEVIMIDLIANGAVLAPFRRNLEGESWSDFFSALMVPIYLSMHFPLPFHSFQFN